MNEKLSKMRAFCKRHKKEIAITAVVGVVCVTIMVATKKKPTNGTSFSDILDMVHKNSNDKIGVFREKGNHQHKVYAINNIKLEEIGVFCEDLVKHVGIKPDIKISALVEVTD